MSLSANYLPLAPRLPSRFAGDESDPRVRRVAAPLIYWRGGLCGGVVSNPPSGQRWLFFKTSHANCIAMIGRWCELLCAVCCRKCLSTAGLWPEKWVVELVWLGRGIVGSFSFIFLFLKKGIFKCREFIFCNCNTFNNVLTWRDRKWSLTLYWRSKYEHRRINVGHDFKMRKIRNTGNSWCKEL